jgi:hypothetical protein
MSPNVPMQTPAAATSLYAQISRSFPTLTKRSGGAITVKVNGDVVKPGEHSAEVLGLLGIVPEELDDAFWRFVGSGNWPYIEYGTDQMPDHFAQNNQQGAGWELEAWVESGAGVKQVKDLAYCDSRKVRRYLTLRMRQWNRINYATYAENNFDDSVGRSYGMISHGMPVEAGGAVGSWYSGVDDGEIAATRSAAHALEAARRNLGKAFDEMEIAIKVADAAWQGNRADAAKYKFAMEASIVESIGAVAHGWEDFIQDVVRQQGLAKDHDDKFKREVAAEIAITVAVGLITFGAGALIKGTMFAAKLARWADEVAAIQALMRTGLGRTMSRVANSSAGAKSLRVIARTMGDMTTTAAVKGVTGQDVTAQDWMFSFLLAGTIGQATSDFAKWSLGSLETRFGIKFASPAGKGGAKGAIQGQPRAGAAMGLTDNAFDRVMAGYGVGIPSEAWKETVKTRMRTELNKAMKEDPAARASAEAAVRREIQEKMIYLPLDSRKVIDDMVTKEIARRVDAAVDPMLDYLFGAANRAVVQGGTNVRDGAGIPSNDLRSGSDGLVAQPRDHPKVAAP